MSRNFTLQVILAGLLGAVLLALIIQIIQFNSIEADLIEVRKQTQANAKALTELQNSPSRPAYQSGSSALSRTSDAELDAALREPGNILSRDTIPRRAPNAALGGQLRIARSSDYKGFNRLLENGADVDEFYSVFLGDRLAERHVSDPNRWAPRLATSVIPNKDQTVIHIKLRKDVLWHKPSVDFSDSRYGWLKGDHPLTSDDFAFMIELLLDPQVQGAAPRRSYFGHFDRIEVLGPHEFKVHWKESQAGNLPTTLRYIVPLPRWLYAFDEDGSAYSKETLGSKINSHWYNDRPIGTGPYTFVANKTGEFVKLSRNESYYGTKPAIQDVLIKIIKSDEMRLLQLKKGEIDFATLSPTQYKREIQDDPSSPFNNGTLKHDTFTRLVYFYLGWNGDGSFFDDRRVRLAMTHAFNRTKILSQVLQSLGRIISGPFHIDTPWNDTSIEPYPFDLEKAAAQLDAAGWIDSDDDGVRDKKIKGQKKDFKFNFLIYGHRPEYKILADIFKEDLLKIGVRMTITPADWPTMQKKMDDKSFDAFSGGWGLVWDNDPYQLWHSSQADIPKGSNRVGFRNKEADAIIEEARTTFDIKKRTKLFHRFHKILHEEQPYTFFYTPNAVMAWNPRVQNVTVQKVRPQILYNLFWLQQDAP